jgi:hypothetical protein
VHSARMNEAGSRAAARTMARPVRLDGGVANAPCRWACAGDRNDDRPKPGKGHRDEELIHNSKHLANALAGWRKRVEPSRRGHIFSFYGCLQLSRTMSSFVTSK